MNEILKPRPSIDEWLEAAVRDDTAFVVEHLNRGMEVDYARDNTTALMMAVRGCHIELIRVLLDHGADLSLENSLGYTAMTYAVFASRSGGDNWDNPEANPEPLELLLAAGGRYRILEAVLLNDLGLARVRLDEGADVNTGEDTYYGPLLKIASELGDLDIVNLLLDRGADIEATDDLNQRALMIAVCFGRIEVVRCLLDRGALLFFDLKDDLSPLAEAARQGRVDVAQLLIERGADLHAVGIDGLTPLAWAVRKDQAEVARVLKLAGAVR
jgi:ankyrin repeat protein